MATETQERERVLPGGGIIVDRRTDEQRARTVGFVVATDSFMSGWGQAPGRSLFAVPIYDWDKESQIILDNMDHRSEMKRARLVYGTYRPRLREGDHLSIVEGGEPWTTPGHFALQAAKRKAGI